jgi:hypothetical protein
MALLGHGDEDTAGVLGVNTDTFRRWRHQKPELELAIWKGMDMADAQVAETLFKCALGYTYEEDYVANYKGDVKVVRVTKYAKPDAEAARKWLAARRRETWGDAQHVETNQTIINVNRYDFSTLSTEELMLAKKLRLQAPAANGDGS